LIYIILKIRHTPYVLNAHTRSTTIVNIKKINLTDECLVAGVGFAACNKYLHKLQAHDRITGALDRLRACTAATGAAFAVWTASLGALLPFAVNTAAVTR
jgi:hypothetical protein